MVARVLVVDTLKAHVVVVYICTQVDAGAGVLVDPAVEVGAQQSQQLGADEEKHDQQVLGDPLICNDNNRLHTETVNLGNCIQGQQA